MNMLQIYKRIQKKFKLLFTLTMKLKNSLIKQFLISLIFLI